MKIIFSLALWFLFNFYSKTYGQQPVYTSKENIIYGMVSGAALLMDVHEPANKNGKAILVIPGSAFGFVYENNYNELDLKADFKYDTAYLRKWVLALLQQGFTVFVINHRFTPEFKEKEIFADCQRAVRFIRFHAGSFGIDAKNIGAMGHSSGANLVTMLGLIDLPLPNAKNKLDSCSPKVQAVVTLAAPFNLADFNTPKDSTINNPFLLAVINSYTGEQAKSLTGGGYELSDVIRKASPYYQVNKEGAPTLIYYSDNDPLIPPRQAVAMQILLQKENVPSKAVLSKNTGHNPLPNLQEVGAWFLKYLN